jgi:hypothetical protein
MARPFAVFWRLFSRTTFITLSIYWFFLFDRSSKAEIFFVSYPANFALGNLLGTPLSRFAHSYR